MNKDKESFNGELIKRNQLSIEKEHTSDNENNIS